MDTIGTTTGSVLNRELSLLFQRFQGLCTLEFSKMTRKEVNGEGGGETVYLYYVDGPPPTIKHVKLVS